MYISQISIISDDISRNEKVEKSLFFFFSKSTYFWSSRLQMFFKVVVLKRYAIFTGNHLRWSHFWIKFQSFRPATLKVTPTKVLFCQYCKIFQNSFSHRTPPVAASVTCKRRSLFQDVTWLILSINSGLWTLADWLFSYAQKSREGIVLILKCCWLYLIYNSKVFNKYIFDFKKIVKSSTLFVRAKV